MSKGSFTAVLLCRYLFVKTNADIVVDLQPANILFSVDISASSDMPMEQPEFSPVQWLPNVKSDDSAPQYLVTSQRPRGVLDDTDFNKLSVKIGDFGGGISFFCSYKTFEC